MPRYGSHELLGIYFPVLDILRRPLYALKSSGQRRCVGLTSLVQRWGSRTSLRPRNRRPSPRRTPTTRVSLIPISLIVMLTIMVVTRVVAQSKKVRNTTEAGGLYEIAVVVLTKPCTLYTPNLSYLSKCGGLGPTLRISYDQFSPKPRFVLFVHFPDIARSWNGVKYSR